MKISVVIPTRNRAGLLKKCLESLAKQAYNKRNYEVIVVDDGPDTEDSRIAVESFSIKSRNVKYFRQKQSGPAAARNLGISVSSAPIVAFIDDDSTAGKNWLSFIDEAFLRNKDIWAVEGKTLTSGKIGPFSNYMVNIKGGMFVTCNMAFKKNALKAVKGFDERFKHANREDSDVAFSIIEKGGKIKFVPEALVKHAALKSGFRAKLKKKAFFRYDALLMKKHKNLYRAHIKFPLERFTPLYILFSLLTLINPKFILLLIILTLYELNYRKYKYNVADFLKFFVLQTVGSWIILAAVFFGAYKFRVNPVRFLIG